ncbi:MAG: SRPBCC family protein [Tannerella sp.]|jgi:hypothetical protein|nr:SRPBCC family protein [Tannerella sp.]
MIDFNSEVKTVPYSDGKVFAVLSDLSNLERVRERIPQETVQNLSFDRDRCSFDVSPLGRIELRVVERVPNQTVRFETANSPIPLLLLIQLKPESETVTEMRMTLRAELNPVLRTMVSKQMKELVDKLSGLVAAISYD